MDQALRDTIQYHVGRGFELETLTPDNRVTLVRDGEVLRLWMEGASVFLQHEAPPASEAPPPGRSWLAIALLALSLIVALALLIFAALPRLLEQPAGVDAETAAPPVATPAATAPAATAHSDLLPAGANEGVDVALPRPLRDGEQAWLMLRRNESRDESRNGVYDGMDVDRAINDAAAGTPVSPA